MYNVHNLLKNYLTFIQNTYSNKLVEKYSEYPFKNFKTIQILLKCILSIYVSF